MAINSNPPPGKSEIQSRIFISEEESRSGVMSTYNVETAYRRFEQHGFVIIDNAIDATVIERLRVQMRADAETCLSWPDLNYNQGAENSNFSMTPPLLDDLLLKDIYANRHATAVMEEIIGSKPKLCWASSNVAVEDSRARQAVHSDAYIHTYPFTYCIEVNICLQT